MGEIVSNNSEETSLRDLILKLYEWIVFFLKRWFLIGIFGLCGGISGFIYADRQKIKFTAKTTFILEEGKSNSSGLGGLASLAGQFGVDVGGNSGAGGVLSGDNILLYFKSPSLAREVLLSNYDSSSKRSIADFYAEVYGLTQGWVKNKKIGKITFPVLGQKVYYTRLQDSLLQRIISSIISTQFHVAKVDKKAGFIDVSTTMQNEMLAKIYCERIVQKVVERYINIKTQRQNATVQKLQLRVDSIAFLLRQKTISGANLQNISSTMDINPLYKSGTNVEFETTFRDKSMLTSIFASVIQSLEMAKFTLSQETPVIQIIDEPVFPLKKEKLSRFNAALAGSIFSAFIFLFWLLTKRIYLKIMKGEVWD